MEKLLTVKDLCEASQLRPITIYKRSAAGRIPGRVKLGVALRFKRSEIEKWLSGERSTDDEIGGR